MLEIVPNGDNIYKMDFKGQDAYALKKDGTLLRWDYNKFVHVLNDVVDINPDINYMRVLQSNGDLWEVYPRYVANQWNGYYVKDVRKIDSGVKAINKGFADKDEITVINGESYEIVESTIFPPYLLTAEGKVLASAAYGNRYGELGNGTISNTSKYEYTEVHNLSDVVDIIPANKAGYAIHSDGTVSVWGSPSGESISFRIIKTPVKIEGLTDIVDIIPQRFYSYAIQSDGTLLEIDLNKLPQISVKQVDDVKLSLELSKSSDASAKEEATQSVIELEQLVSEGLTSQDSIDSVTTQLQDIEKIVSELPDGAGKDELIAKIEDIKEQITIAQNILNATNSVNSLESFVNSGLGTQELINEANTKVNESQSLISLLPNGEVKDTLQERLNQVEDKIELAQATLEVVELENVVSVGLDTQDSLNIAKEQLNAATTLVNALPSTENKDSLISRISEAQYQINLAQAILDITNAEQSATQEDLNKAIESISLLPEGSVKNDLLEKANVVQQIIDANNLLEGIISADFTDFNSIDAALKQLEEAKVIIDNLPNNTTTEKHLNSLLDKYQQVKDYLAVELINVLEASQKGKPVRLSNESVDLLVEYAIKETNATSIKDKGDVKHYVMPKVSKHATGKQVNDSIDKFLK